MIVVLKYLDFVYHHLFEPSMKINFPLIYQALVLIRGCRM
jgi:hypothetical protein